MTITDVKSDLHRLVVETDDLDILKAIQHVFTAMRKKKTTDWYEQLSEKNKQLIQIGLAQAERGELIPHAEVRSRIDAFIKSKS